MINKMPYVLTPLNQVTDGSDIDVLLSTSDNRKDAFLIGDVESDAFTASFKYLADANNQGTIVAWVLKDGDKIIGLQWLHKEDTDDVQSPSLHAILKNDEVTVLTCIKEATRYAYCHLPFATLHSRHVVNGAVVTLDKKLGFEKDGDIYSDEQGQKWQNVSLVL